MLFNLDEKNLKVNLNECAKERTIVFVDYEAFAYGCMNQYRTEPNVSEWFKHLKGVGKIDEVLYFADWTEENIKNHVSRLRNFSTALIDCTKDNKEKEVADFIMLDSIYQKLIKQREVSQFVLFTGDKHFQSVVAFLRNFNDKKVGIYSLEASYCKALADVADWYISVVPAIEMDDRIVKAIIENLKKAEGRDGFIPMLRPTARAVSNYIDIEQNEIENTMLSMIEEGILEQIETVFPDGRPARKLVVKWERWKEKAM